MTSDTDADQQPTSQRNVLSPVDLFTEALITERRVIDQLIAVMRRQRHAVSADDLQSVDDSVFATHRILLTLSETRERRRNLNTLIGHREDLGVHALDEALGARMTPALRVARDELQGAARALSHEVAMNRRVLREALAGSQMPAPLD